MTSLHCSICNRTVGEIERIISGPDPAHPVYICSKCVELCAGIIWEGTGEADARRQFRNRPPFYDRLRFIIPVLVLMGIIFCIVCIRAYYEGGLPKLEETAAVWLTAALVSVLAGFWLRKLRQVKK
jgi:hypothetical protein